MHYTRKIATFAALLTLGLLGPEAGFAGESRPNFIVFIADDVSWNDVGAYGHPTVRTPTIDRLATEGLRFDNAYLTASSCSPSRSSILTGRYPHNTDAEQLHWELPAEQVTFANILRGNGYWAAAAGKWHLGPHAIKQFDVVRQDIMTKGVDRSGAEEWLAVLEERPRDKPFFMWFAAWDAHRPFYAGAIDEPYTQDDVQLPPYYPATELYVNDFAQYYDEITRFDNEIARVLDALKEQGELDNTVVLIMADNGRPYARDKATLYDGGVKTPFVLSWPDGIDTPGVVGTIVSSVDIAPTFLELAGVATPDSIEGESFVKLLSDPSASFRDYAVSERNWHDFEDHGRSVRTQRFRYIRNNYPDLNAAPSGDTIYHATWAELVRLYQQGALTEQQKRPFRAPRPTEELYDVVADPHELRNLADIPDYADELRRHRDLLDDWIEDTGDFIPSVRTPDDFDRETGERMPTGYERPRRSKKEMYGHGQY